MEAFFVPGITTLITFSAIFYFLLNQIGQAQKKSVIFSLIISGATLSSVNLLTVSKVLGSDPNFTTIGGILPQVIFLSTLIPLALGLFLSEKDLATKIFLGICGLIIVISLGIGISEMLPGKPLTPTFLDWKTSWAVTIDSVKENPLLGVGPGNFVSAFDRFRPLTFNQTPNWEIRFTTSRSFFLKMVAETGILGIFALILFAISLYRKMIEAKTSETLYPSLSLGMLLISFVLFPGAGVTLFLLFVLLSLNSKTLGTPLTLSGTKFLGIFIILGVITFAWYVYPIISAEAIFNNAISAFNKGDGKTSYDLLISAINKNPRVDRYHATYSQLNFALANSLSTKKELSDDERNTISNLLGQSVREAKAAVSLNIGRAANWELLGRTYQAIMPFTKGADAFAIQSLSQAVTLDPINPNLRIVLGGVYYSLGRFDEAIDTFRLATLAKPNLANAHYNLAAAYREKGETDKAIAEMKIVLSLVQRDSQDDKLAKSELENLEKKKPSSAKATEAQESLTPPQPAPTPLASPIPLPQDAYPPNLNQ